MIYITQLIYVKHNKEDVFLEFENYVIPIISKHGGELILRIRTDDNAMISAEIEPPYEVHIIRFNSESNFNDFLKDEERANYLHLKEESIKESFLIIGKKM